MYPQNIPTFYSSKSVLIHKTEDIKSPQAKWVQQVEVTEHILSMWLKTIRKAWKELLLFLGTYISIGAVYQLCLKDGQKVYFEKLSRYCHEHTNVTSVSLVLGFYMMLVTKRWWSQYSAIPRPDAVALMVSQIQTDSNRQDEGRQLKTEIMRHTCLALTLLLRQVSSTLKNECKTYKDPVDMRDRENEDELRLKIEEKQSKEFSYLIPIKWANQVLRSGKARGIFTDTDEIKGALEELNRFCGECRLLTLHTTISIPVIYTHVVKVAVYTFLVASAMGRQWFRNDSAESGDINKETTKILDLIMIFPYLTLLQVICYVGWMKLAESIAHPFQDKEDPFHLKTLVKRNFKMCELFIDEVEQINAALLEGSVDAGVFSTAETCRGKHVNTECTCKEIRISVD